jgi:hypothetical protein
MALMGCRVDVIVATVDATIVHVATIYEMIVATIVDTLISRA